MKRLFLLLLASFVIWACSGSDSAPAVVATGAENGQCFANGTCNAGLVCLSSVCVNPGDGGAIADGGGGNKDSGSSNDAGTTNDSSPNDTGIADANASDVRDDAGNACPGANILHPGTETRNVNTSVPFVGRGRDATCAAITGAKLVWVDSLEGQIGTGETFNHTFTQTGSHTVTLTATDAQNNKYTASVTFMII